MFMEGKNIGNFFHNLKNKFKNNNNDIDSSINEYVFDKNDLDELQKENKEKIKELKKEIFVTEKKKEILDEKELNETILNKAFTHNNSTDIKEEKEITETPSFVHLEEEYQEIIMSKWKSIDMNEIDNDIIQGKDLLNHNYTITFPDESTKYINQMRKKYEVIISYLIGFNNEKKGINNKITFADDPDNEWKYLNYYIKLLEKIRNFKIK